MTRIPAPPPQHLALAVLASLSLSPLARALHPQGGHQVTPQITEWVIAATQPQPSNGDWTTTGVPTVAEVSGKYTVAFRGSKFPAQELGIYYWDTTPNGPIAAFEEGDLVPSIELAPPQTPFSGTIGDFIEGGAPPAISANGRIAQIVELSSISPFFSGAGVVRHVIATGLDTVTCNSSQPVNGAAYLLNAITRPVSIDALGTVGFHCSIKTAAGVSAGSGIFREAVTGIDKVAATADAANGTVPAGSFMFVGGNSVGTRDQQWNSSNKPAFFGTTTVSGPNAVGATGIWTETATGVASVALSNGVAWDSSPLKWSTFDSPSINDSGDIAFRACLTTSACGDVGIWARISGVQILIARDGDPAPSPTGASTTNEFFVDFGMPVIDAQGRVAFWATTDSPGNPQGIWIADGTGPTGIRRIARKDDLVRGTNALFGTFDKDLGLADTGQVAFTATLNDSSKGLFVESEYQSLIKIARTTELFPLPNGTSPAINNIVFYPGSSAQGVGGLYGNPSSLPDSVAVAFQLAFPNGHSAVVLTTVGP